MGSDNDDNSSDEALSVEKNRPASLDKMIALVAHLVERSRGSDSCLKLSTKDYNAIAGGKVNIQRNHGNEYLTTIYLFLEGFSIPVSASEGQYKSTPNETPDTCFVSLG